MNKLRSWCFNTSWKQASLHTMLICSFIISLFYYWFVVADRHKIFLYNHLGSTPFDKPTSSRYWMSGLVSSGAVTILYTIINWFLGRIAGLYYQKYIPPAWWRVWLLCTIPLTISIFYITMNFNQPSLPFSNALECVMATLFGLALALLPGSLAAQQPNELSWLVFTGIGLLPSFLLLRVIEAPNKGFVDIQTSYLIAIGGTFVGTMWLAIVAWFQVWKYRLCIEANKLFITGFCLSYLIMPLIHYLLFVPPEFRYITTSKNFFASNKNIQLISFLISAILTMGFTQLQRRLQHHFNKSNGRVTHRG